MLWLAAYLTGFPPVGLHALRWTHGLAPMWSGLYLISTENMDFKSKCMMAMCQYPLGLIPHFYEDTVWLIINNGGECQCPLGLIPHFYEKSVNRITSYNESRCQCPLGLIPHFYRDDIFYTVDYKNVSMPSRAYTSFLRYHFKNLGFMRFPEPVFAGIYQNILTTAVFLAC